MCRAVNEEGVIEVAIEAEAEEEPGCAGVTVLPNAAFFIASEADQGLILSSSDVRPSVPLDPFAVPFSFSLVFVLRDVAYSPERRSKFSGLMASERDLIYLKMKVKWRREEFRSE